MSPQLAIFTKQAKTSVRPPAKRADTRKSLTHGTRPARPVTQHHQLLLHLHHLVPAQKTVHALQLFHTTQHRNCEYFILHHVLHLNISTLIFFAQPQDHSVCLSASLRSLPGILHHPTETRRQLTEAGQPGTPKGGRGNLDRRRSASTPGSPSHSCSNYRRSSRGRSRLQDRQDQSALHQCILHTSHYTTPIHSRSYHKYPTH